MSWSGIARTGALLSLLGASALVTACRDQSPIAPGDRGESMRVYGEAAVRLSITRATGPEPGTFAYTMRLVDPGSRAAAYQGTVEFAPETLDVISVRTFEPASGEFRIVNSADAARGRIRFAAFSLDGFRSDQVLTIVARPRPSATGVPFAAVLELVADRSGARLGRPSETPFRTGQDAFSLASLAGPPFIALNLDTVASRRVLPRGKIAIPTIVNVDSAGTMTLASLGSRITWNVQRLAFDSVKPGSGSGWNVTTNTSQAASGIVSFAASGLAPLAASKTLVTAYFTAAADTAGTMVTLTPLAATDTSGAVLLAAVRPRGMAVCVAPSGDWGDANDDALVNIIDAQQIARWSVGLSVLDTVAVQTRGDVTADGAVNIIDAQQVARFSVGLSAAARTGTSAYNPPPTTAIVLQVPATTLAVGTSVQVDYHTHSSDGTDQTGCSSVAWNSSNTGVAVVNATGLISAIAPGSARITVTSNGVVAALDITVTGP